MFIDGEVQLELSEPFSTYHNRYDCDHRVGCLSIDRLLVVGFSEEIL